MSDSENNKRIAKNTLMLYFRQILTLLVSLFTVRIVLDVLGVEDYGIYSVIGGIVALFSFLSASMASATQRFFSFAIGQNNLEKLKRTFTTNWIIYGAIAIVAFVLLETIGLWFVNHQLKVPLERLEAAKWVFHFSVLSFIVTIISTPFTAIILAHEDMHIYAYISIFEAFMKLGIVYLLVYLPWDKLEAYGVLLFASSSIKAIIYIGICSKKYIECQYRKFYWDKALLRDTIGFTGWTLFGSLSSVGRNQGITILLNQVFNPATVAARAIATNITNQINIFSASFNVGLYPPIIKTYAANDKNQMFSLIFNGAKITFFLMWVFALPLFLEMEIILNIWLKNPPPETVLFSRLALVEVLINAISLPITTAARAPGKMKVYELSLGTIQLLIFVSAWVILKLGGAAYSVYVVLIVANLVMFIVRLLIVRVLIGLDISSFLKTVALPIWGIIILSAIPSFAVHHILPKEMSFSFISGLLSVTISSVCMYFLGLNKSWRQKVRTIITHRIQKLF